MKKIIKRIINFILRQSDVLLNNYMDSLLFSERFQDSKRLLKYEYTVFAHCGEDGIIHEIFNRIGVSNSVFVEFGGHDGSFNNSTNLLLNDWSGLWIEADPKMVERAKTTFKRYVDSNNLKIEQNFVTVENIENIFKKNEIPVDFDFLSIDIDFYDYYVWEAIKSYSPRMIIIEYNASLGPHNALVVPYKKNIGWEKTSYFGASLKALEILGTKKGYSLVACDPSGSNAFFVRSDLIKDNFHPPFSAEHHYEPPRYFLTYKKNGHKRKIGEYINIKNKT